MQVIEKKLQNMFKEIPYLQLYQNIQFCIMKEKK